MTELVKILLFSAAALVVGLIVGGLIGYFRRKKVAEAEIGSAEAKAKKIVDDAAVTVETMKKEALIEAKEETLRLRNETEHELKERRAEVTRMERRVNQKEENLDKKAEALDRKSEQLDKKLHENDALREQIEQALAAQQARLEEISGITAEQAKEELIASIESEVKHDLAKRLDELESQFREEADDKARNIITLAIQRCAADQVSEATISAVPLPNDEMKGRIIGREGRNIQKLETLTGVELIIDDTPEAITLSGFDPVRREV
ncbi:MAG: DUF3552 domain-containing protein, partial [Clostridia bacterium]|nr:DUF3552 domain-containing protein [Clostridia bacterium]